jgi:hypothetical protein
MDVNGATCEICNPQVLHTMSGDLYDKCLAAILNRASVVEQKLDTWTAVFEDYILDTNHEVPTVTPTIRPTRRRRSRAPAVTANGL